MQSERILVTGGSGFIDSALTLFDKRASRGARILRPSPRSELEITDLNALYLGKNQLHCQVLPKSVHWIDAGTPDSLEIAKKHTKDYDQI